MFLCHTWVRSQFPEFSWVSSPLRLCLMCFGTSNLEGPHDSLNTTNQINFPNPRDRCFWVHTSCIYLRSSHLQSVAMPCHECFFSTHGTTCQSPTWPSRLLSIPVWMVSKRFFFQNEPLIKSPLFPSFHGQLILHQSFFLIPHLQSTIFDPYSNPQKDRTGWKHRYFTRILPTSIFFGVAIIRMFLSNPTKFQLWVRWFHAGRRFSQIEEHGVAINI